MHRWRRSSHRCGLSFQSKDRQHDLGRTTTSSRRETTMSNATAAKCLVGLGIHVPRLRQARMSEWRAHSSRASKGLGGQYVSSVCKNSGKCSSSPIGLSTASTTRKPSSISSPMVGENCRRYWHSGCWGVESRADYSPAANIRGVNEVKTGMNMASCKLERPKMCSCIKIRS